MGLSGLVGGAVGDELQQILAQRMLQEQMRQRQEQQAIENARAEREQAFREGQETRRADEFQAARRDRSNEAGLRHMRDDREMWEKEVGQRQSNEALAAIQDDPNIPDAVKQIVGLRRIGVSGVSPQDLESPETRDARIASEEDRKVRLVGREADARAAAEARHRPPPKAPGDGMTPAQAATAKAFMDDYARDSKTYLTVRNAFQQVAGAAERPDAAGDLSLIFGYMKMLDPNSVVRETEFANAQNAAGVPDQIRNAYNRAVSGERLNPGQRKQFVGQAQRLMTAAHQNQQKVRQTYGSRAQKFGIDPSVVLDEEDNLDTLGGSSSEAPNRRPIPGIPGAEAELRDGKWIRVK